MNLTLIPLDLRITNVFVRKTWTKTRGLLEFQLLLITLCHSEARIALNQRPNELEGVAYELVDCGASRHHRSFHTAS